jgi:hypothetical protein
VGASTSHNPKGLQGLERGKLYLYLLLMTFVGNRSLQQNIFKLLLQYVLSGISPIHWISSMSTTSNVIDAIAIDESYPCNRAGRPIGL